MCLHNYKFSDMHTLCYTHNAMAGLFTGSVRNLESFDLLFSSDNSVNGTGFHASFQVYSTTLTQSFLFDASLDQGQKIKYLDAKRWLILFIYYLSHM